MFECCLYFVSQPRDAEISLRISQTCLLQPIFRSSRRSNPEVHQAFGMRIGNSKPRFPSSRPGNHSNEKVKPSNENRDERGAFARSMPAGQQLFTCKPLSFDRKGL